MNPGVDPAEGAALWAGGDRLDALLHLAAALSDSARYAQVHDVLCDVREARTGVVDSPPPSPTALRRAFFAACDASTAPLGPAEGLDDAARRLHEAAAAHPSLGWLADRALEFQRQPQADGPLRVAVFGVFSAGKSSLLNALLGTELLKTGLVPVTCALTRIEWGSSASATVRFSGGAHKEVGPEALARWTDQAEREDGDTVEEVVLRLPHPLLKRLTFLDTPGFNSGSDLHELVAEKVVAECDVVLWVFNATKSGSEIERRELHHIERSAGKAIGVLSQIDKVRPAYGRKPEQWNRSLREVQEVLEHRLSGLLTQWVWTSEPWLKEDHPASGRLVLDALFEQFQRQRESLKAQARERRLLAASREAITLERLSAEEAAQRQEISQRWKRDRTAFLEQALEDWLQEVALAKRANPSLSIPTRRDGPSPTPAGLLRLCPDLEARLGRAGVSPWSNPRLSGLLEPLTALESLADVLDVNDKLGKSWHWILGRAAALEAGPQGLPWRWLPHPPEALGVGGSLLGLLLREGDRGLARTVVSQNTSQPTRGVTFTDLWRAAPAIDSTRTIERAIPTIGPAIHAAWFQREVTLVLDPKLHSSLSDGQVLAALAAPLEPRREARYPAPAKQLRAALEKHPAWRKEGAQLACSGGSVMVGSSGAVLQTPSDASPLRASVREHVNRVGVDALEAALGFAFLLVALLAGLGAAVAYREPIGYAVYIPASALCLLGVLVLRRRQRRRAADRGSRGALALFKRIRDEGADRALVAARRFRRIQALTGGLVLALLVVGTVWGAWAAVPLLQMDEVRGRLVESHQRLESNRSALWARALPLLRDGARRAGLGDVWPGEANAEVPPVATGEIVFVQSTALVLRAGPSTAHRKVGLEQINAKLTVLAGDGGAEHPGWLQVRAEDGTVGWAGLDFLSPTPLSLSAALLNAGHAAEAGDGQSRLLWLERANALASDDATISSELDEVRTAIARETPSQERN